MRTRTSCRVLVCALAILVLAHDAAPLSLAQQDSVGPLPFNHHVRFPPNLSISPDLTEAVASMVRDSPTFRRQCAIIRANQRLRVRIVLETDTRRSRLASRARCDMSRHAFGAISALVRVWSRKDAIELVAHELEHVIEFAEGTNYYALALQRPGTVWKSGPGVFETLRALRAGDDVKREMSLAVGKVARRN